MALVQAPVPHPSVASTGIPADEVIDALLAGVVRVNRRVEIYESDAETPFDIPAWNARLVGGQVTVDGARDERRMCEIELENDDGALKLDPYRGFWYDKVLKVFWGIRYSIFNGSFYEERAWEVQIGEFMIDRISEDDFPNVVKVTGRDFTKKCITTAFSNSLQFGNKTPVEQIIRALAANAGIKKFRLPHLGINYQDDVVYEAGAARWKAMKELAESIGYELYFTGDGYLTMRPYPDPATSPVMWIFRTGKLDGSLVTYSRSTDDSRLKNHTIVIGAVVTDDAGFSTVPFGEVRNDDPNSPTNIGRIGDRVDFFKSDYIRTSEQAQALAESRFRIASLEEYTIDFSSIILPWLEGNDIVHIINEKESDFVPARFLLSNFTLPLSLGPMTGNGKRVTLVGTKKKFGVL